MRNPTCALSLVLLALPGIGAAADDGDGLLHALWTGTPSVDVRARYEHVEQDNALEAADAYTLRARLGYTSAKWHDIDLLTEFEGTYSFGAEAYNSGINGNLAHSTIADPRGLELNQFALSYSGLAGTTVKIGRQRIVLDDQRFIGNSAWRQNEVTFDAVSLVNQSLLDHVTLTYDHVTRVNASSYSSAQMKGHLANVNWTPAGWLSLVAFGYWLDFDTDPAPAALVRQFDSRTYGLRASGAVSLGESAKLLYAAAYADQAHFEDSPASLGAHYYLGELGASAWGVTAKFGYEVLGGDGDYGFQTPLATLHAFQGWADQFLTTPKDGIRDAYIRIDAAVPWKIKALALAHDFRADMGSGKYGTEIDVQATRPLAGGMAILLKYADYDADAGGAPGASVDTRKAWLQVEYKF